MTTTQTPSTQDFAWRIERVGSMTFAFNPAAGQWRVIMFGKRGEWHAEAWNPEHTPTMRGAAVVGRTQQEAAEAAFAARFDREV